MKLLYCFGVLLIALVGLSLGQTKCPSKYRKVGNKCYSFAEMPNSNFTSAIDVCKNLNGTLAMIKSKEEDDALRNYLPHYFPWDHWIGGYLSTSSGTWTWQPTNEEIIYTGWGPGEPDNGGGGAPENCLTITLKSYTSEEDRFDIWWDDRSCNRLYGVICQTAPL